MACRASAQSEINAFILALALVLIYGAIATQLARSGATN